MEHICCPRCGDAWYNDIEPETGVPYTCYFCCNGTIEITQEMIDAEREPTLDERELDERCAVDYEDEYDYADEYRPARRATSSHDVWPSDIPF